MPSTLGPRAPPSRPSKNAFAEFVTESTSCKCVGSSSSSRKLYSSGAMRRGAFFTCVCGFDLAATGLLLPGHVE